jgi:hypothetical protein
MTIDFVKFKNYLIKNNILLFDSQYRISHFRLNNLHLLINDNNQNGGGNNISNSKIIKKVKKLKPSILNHLINSLLDKNIERIKYIFNSCV